MPPRAPCNHAELMAMARSCELGPITHIGGLGTAEWERLAVLASYVTELPHEVAATLPMVLPPNRLRLFNPIRALQALITRATHPPRLERPPGAAGSAAAGRWPAQRLQPPGAGAGPARAGGRQTQHTEQIRWALEDAWRQSLVQKRWQRWALQLSAEQAEQLVARAAAKGLAHHPCAMPQQATRHRGLGPGRPWLPGGDGRLRRSRLQKAQSAPQGAWLR